VLTVAAHIDFCGEIYPILPDRSVTVGRVGDLMIDDNPFLHRTFLEVGFQDSLLWLSNVGSAISATVADDAGLVQSWLSPGARLPVVFTRSVVWFTAGPTTYDFEILVDDAPFVPVAEMDASHGETTLGRVSFTPDQRLLVVALAEGLLRGSSRSGGSIPRSVAAAERLGWTTTKFNRKLDNVCQKLDRIGIRGLVGNSNGSASARRARLVEYALAARLVNTDDLQLLDTIDASSTR